MIHSDFFHKLDNPAWYSLAEKHQPFAIGSIRLKRYQKNIVSFFAYDQAEENALSELNGITDAGETFFIIGSLSALPSKYHIESRLSCVQMICFKLTNLAPPTEVIELLEPNDEQQMLALINMVQPGYFLPGTRFLGDYYGIRQNGQLVAVTGERMRMHGLTEISAVVTHPDFTGRQYAQQLVAHVSNKNIDADIIPFLHVAESNERAIGIYQRLGFTRRRAIDFWKIRGME
jgi:ribosomal protein S18 acetylase RimI-like enzyme